MRSLTKGTLAPMFSVPGIEWCSVAREAWNPELGALGLPDGLAGCHDWHDTAERIQSLDLIVTVDTAIAHLAGGLGVPVWILLAAVPDMRWMIGRPDTPWYRSARLYRQSVIGDWMPVVQQVAHDLTLEVEARRLKAAA